MSAFRNNYHGFGDASDVGAGKTLTSLEIAAKLIKENNITYSGILVLLPGTRLVDTWKNELDKHTIGFDIIYQDTTSSIGPINRNTILITTMGRMRDHPINHKWLLVIIDECLTVQNKNALWTESAWKQSLMSKYLLMMSATFFRTRFDKLYYMFKNVTNRSTFSKRIFRYDTIRINCFTNTKIKRKWSSNINYFKLDSQSRKEYDMVDRSNLNNEVKFSKLTSI